MNKCNTFTTYLRQCWHQIERNFPRYRYNERENYCESFYMITHPNPHLKFIRLNLVISDEYYIYSYNVYKILVLSIAKMIHSNFLSHYNGNEENFFQFDANTASDK
jgi:hypothetical protein